MSKPSLFKSFLFLFLISYLKTQGAEQKTQAIVQTQEGQVKEINPMPELIKMFKESCKKAGVNTSIDRCGAWYNCERIIAYVVAVFTAVFTAVFIKTRGQALTLQILCGIFIFFIGIAFCFNDFRCTSKRKALQREFRQRLVIFLKQAFKKQSNGVLIKAENQEVDKFLNWALASNLTQEFRAKVFTQRLNLIKKYPTPSFLIFFALKQSLEVSPAKNL